MKKETRITLFLTAGLLLLVIPAAANAGAPVGSTFTIRAAAELEMEPAVAYNSQRQEYLVVFWNDRPGCDDIRAERVSRDGKLLGGVWVAAGCPADRYHPDVAYNSQANEYLVIWEEDDLDIRGQRISATGGLVGGAFDIALGVPSFSACYAPAVAYASTENKYLVVFGHYSTTAGERIAAQALNGDGSAWGAGFDIEPFTASGKGALDLAYNHRRNEFLVVWTQHNSSQQDIRGRRVKMAGGAGTLGSAFWFSCDHSKYDYWPAVAAVPRPPDGQYLVTWEYSNDMFNHDIWAQRVAGGGTLEGNAFLVQASGLTECRPAVAGTESSHRYLVTWEQWLSGSGPIRIRGRAISHAGLLLDQVTEFPGVAAYYPAVAAGPAGDFLVAWQDRPVGATNTNIYGQLWGNRGYLPFVLRQSP